MTPQLKRTFFESKEFPFLIPMHEAWQTIQAEWDGARDKALIFPDPSKGLLDSGEWKKCEIFAWGMQVKKNVALVPKTAEIVLAIPGLMQAAFYILGPGSHIAPHRGVTDKVLRSHLGMHCPPNCHLRVGADIRQESDGRLLIFDDMNMHEAWNKSTEWRTVLHLDFFRPEVRDDPTTAGWLKDLRLKLAQRHPQVIPELVHAGVDFDAELRAWFLANPGKAVPERCSPEEWESFVAWRDKS
jgi:aspartyl/asparaginyl beta-hydroxylase (cupin superfamily)